jgi:hypothetical protein
MARNMLFKMMKSQDAVLGIKSVIFYNLLQGLLPFVSDTSPNNCNLFRSSTFCILYWSCGSNQLQITERPLSSDCMEMTCPQAAAKYLVEEQSQQAQLYLHSHPCSCTKNTLQCIALHTSGGNKFILPEGLGWFSLYLSLPIPLSMLYQWAGNPHPHHAHKKLHSCIRFGHTWCLSSQPKFSR